MVRAGALVEPPPVTTTLVGAASVVAAEIADVESVAAETKYPVEASAVTDAQYAVPLVRAFE